MRSRLNASEGNDAQAKADVEKALALNPDLPQGILAAGQLSTGPLAEFLNFNRLTPDLVSPAPRAASKPSKYA